MKLTELVSDLFLSANHEYKKQSGYYEILKTKLELFLAQNPGGSLANPIPINASHYFRVVRNQKYKIIISTSQENAESQIKMYLNLHPDYEVIGPFKLPGIRDSSKFK